MRRENEVKPAQVARLRAARAARLSAGEAQVEAEGDEVTLPVRDPSCNVTVLVSEAPFGTMHTSIMAQFSVLGSTHKTATH